MSNVDVSQRCTNFMPPHPGSQLQITTTRVFMREFFFLLLLFSINVFNLKFWRVSEDPRSAKRGQSVSGKAGSCVHLDEQDKSTTGGKRHAKKKKQGRLVSEGVTE